MAQKHFSKVTSPKSRMSTNSIMPADMEYGSQNCSDYRIFYHICFSLVNRADRGWQSRRRAGIVRIDCR